MCRMITAAIFILSLAAWAAPQSKTAVEPAIKRAELVSPWDIQGTKVRYDHARRQRSCLDLVRLEQVCDGAETLSYGNRAGKNWDIFAISGGRDSRTRMIDLGSYNWNDKFTVPEVEPWPELQPGETRSVTINTSGADGRDAAPGRSGTNADGSIPLETARGKSKQARAKQTIDYANAPLSRQVSSSIVMAGKAPVPDKYTPVTEALKGHMYFIRVLDGQNDNYILLRVDEVVRGSKISISYFSLGPIL